MSIHVILGKPGAGKSMYATIRIITELRESKRNVMTSVPINPGALNEYLQKRYPAESHDFTNRVRVLQDCEMRFFWKFRAPDSVGHPLLYQLDDMPEEKRIEALKVLEKWAKEPTPGGEHGVAYYLDECHIAFNARDWATLGRGALHYLSQHRKLGDIVWPITQAVGNLDKQFRSVAEDFTVLRNEYTAKYGIFRGRGRFVRRTYLSEPSTNSEPFEVGTFQLDKEGAAACYNTAKGIGVHGSKADIGRRAKGIPIMWVIPIAIAIASLAGVVPYLMGKGAGKYVSGGAQKQVEQAAGAVGVVASPAHSSGPAVKSASEVVKPLWVSGTVIAGRSATVMLSDGRVLTEKSPSLERIDHDGVTVAGKFIPYAPVVVSKWDPDQQRGFGSSGGLVR